MPLTILTAAPSPIGQQEHDQITSSTPDSFSDIPPVCHRKEDGVRLHLSPAVEGWDEAEHTGDLYVCSNALEFWSAARSTGLSIPWPLVSLHAISRTTLSTPIEDSEAAPRTNGDTPQQPCIYCQLDEAMEKDLGEEAADDEEEWGETRELTIVPSDPASLDSLFAVFSQCAAAFPSTSADDDGDDGMVFDDADAPGDDLTEGGRATLARLENLVDWSTVPPRRDGVDNDATQDADEE